MRSPFESRAIMVVAAVAVLFSASAGAQNVLEQNQPSGSSDIANFGQPDLAQSFQPGKSPSSGAGILLVAGQGSTDTVTIQLWTALPNAGGATMLAQASAQVAAGQWVDVYWPPVPVTVGQTYYLVFTGNTTLGIAGGDTNNPYPNGITCANAGYQPFPEYDYAFRTWAGGERNPVAGAFWVDHPGCLDARRRCRGTQTFRLTPSVATLHTRRARRPIHLAAPGAAGKCGSGIPSNWPVFASPRATGRCWCATDASG